MKALSFRVKTEEISTLVELACTGCDVCLPGTGGVSECISDCAITEYIDENGDCKACDDDCISCVRSGDCSLCVTPECEECTTFDNCDVCPLACESPRVPDCDQMICVCPGGDYYWEMI